MYNISMKIEKTYTANIYVGLMPGYDKPDIDFVQRRKIVKDICQSYCDKHGLGLTITDTEFVYTDGGEKGVVIGLINYPRFPKNEREIMDLARGIVHLIMTLTEQKRISVVYPDLTIMYEKEDFS